MIKNTFSRNIASKENQDSFQNLYSQTTYNQKIKMFKFLIFSLLILNLVLNCENWMQKSHESIKETTKESSVSFLKRLNYDYLKHLFYHPFHRLHKKHLFHLHKNPKHKNANYSTIKRRMNKKSNYRKRFEE